MVKKRKVISSVFNAEDAESIEKIRNELQEQTGKKYNDNQLIKFFIQFYLENMDATYYPVTEKKKRGAPKKPKKRGRPKDKGR